MLILILSTDVGDKSFGIAPANLGRQGRAPGSPGDPRGYGRHLARFLDFCRQHP